MDTQGIPLEDSLKAQMMDARLQGVPPRQLREIAAEARSQNYYKKLHFNAIVKGEQVGKLSLEDELELIKFNDKLESIFSEQALREIICDDYILILGVERQYAELLRKSWGISA